MTSLVDLMQTEAPERIDVVGRRLSGSVEVVYARTSHLTPAIRFGSDRFGVGTSVVKANGIDCEVAGVTFYRKPDGVWDHDTYRNVRKLIDYRSGSLADAEVSWKTTSLIIDALAVHCPRLHEQFPGAFTRLGVGNEYADGSSFDATVKRHEEDLRITRAFAALYRKIEDGDAVVIPRRPSEPAGTCLYPSIDTELPDEIRWDYPSRDTMASHDVQKGRGPVYGAVWQITGHTGLIGFAVDRSGTPYKPDTYHGPLLVPVELAHRYKEEK